ncbi:MAG: hypothetical protein ACXWW1_02840 [Aeromicrobium sp.]
MCLDEFELVRRIHVAVRDTHWGTVPLDDVHVTVKRSGASFTAALEGRCRSSDLNLELDCDINGRTTGELEFTMDCRALATSHYNRIGICVLLPANLAGRPYAAGTPAGRAPGRLPVSVGPQVIQDGQIHALMPPFASFRVDIASGIGMSLGFTGDEFEIEDQRNWADASFKIYSTPLARGFPHRLEAGERLRQSVTVDIQVAGSRRPGKARTVIKPH